MTVVMKDGTRHKYVARIEFEGVGLFRLFLKLIRPVRQKSDPKAHIFSTVDAEEVKEIIP